MPIKTKMIMSFFVIVGVLWGSISISGLYLHHRLVKMLSSDCENCKSHVGEIGVSILQQWVTLNQIHYETHAPRGTNIELDLKNADIKYRFISLINPWGTPLLEEVVLTGFHITVIDNDKAPGEPIDFIQRDSLAAILNKLPVAKIDRILLKDCLFTYRQTAVDGAVGEIHISKINGLLSSFGTRQSFSPKKVQVNLSALLEQSGKVEISAEWNLFSDDDHGRISMGVSHLKIAELNSYFEPHEKAQLSGILEHFSTQLDLANEAISGQVSAEYDAFKIHYLKTPQQGVIKTWIKNSLNKAVVSSKRPKDPQDKPLAPVSYKRERKDAFTHFLIQGIVPAILHIVTS